MCDIVTDVCEFDMCLSTRRAQFLEIAHSARVDMLCRYKICEFDVYK